MPLVEPASNQLAKSRAQKICQLGRFCAGMDPDKMSYLMLFGNGTTETTGYGEVRSATKRLPAKCTNQSKGRTKTPFLICVSWAHFLLVIFLKCESYLTCESERRDSSLRLELTLRNSPASACSKTPRFYPGPDDTLWLRTDSSSSLSKTQATRCPGSGHIPKAR
jgi:hypothetical protein